MNNEFEELKDIVLDNELDNSNKNKKRLILIAFLVILFLIVLVVMKLVKDSTPNEMTNDMKIPKIEALNTNVDRQVFEQIPIENNDFGDDDLILDELSSNEEILPSENEKTLEEIIAEQKKNLQKQDESLILKVQNIRENEIKEEVVSNLTKIKVIPKTKKIPFMPEMINNSNLIVGTYIQVGAIHRSKPNKKFLQSLKNKNYTYRLYDIKVKGKVYTKVLIGPYRTKNDVSVAIQAIKANINPQAFIYRIKE